MSHTVFWYDDQRGSFIVITDWGDKKKSEEEAIKYAANYYFKTKKDKLECFPVYMEDSNSTVAQFVRSKGMKKFLAVGRK